MCKSPIGKAVENDHIEVVNFILNETNYDSSNDAAFNMKLIQTAVMRNNLEMVSLLKLNFEEGQIE